MLQGLMRNCWFFQKKKKKKKKRENSGATQSIQRVCRVITPSSGLCDSYHSHQIHLLSASNISQSYICFQPISSSTKTHTKSLIILSSIFKYEPPRLAREMLTNAVLSGCYLHCLGRKFSLDNSELIKLSNLFAPGPGLRTVVLPITEHGSVPFSLLPMHQPPGTSMPGPRDKSSESTLSSTGSSWRNFRANGALLSIIFCMS